MSFFLGVPLPKLQEISHCAGRKHLIKIIKCLEQHCRSVKMLIHFTTSAEGIFKHCSNELKGGNSIAVLFRMAILMKKVYTDSDYQDSLS